ncbi:RidA family protein [Clostridium sp.]|uniref:RidA family protein n=1 Tax=Clostridium sp. TaxID=1506 RepID=UPI001D63B545|nr:RidA family protein [Clostridium sp.]MBS5987993.1 RidA family protein [Clostridium sp.]
MRIIHSSNAPKAIGPYSQAIQVGDLVFVSGQIPVNPQTNTIESQKIKGQVKQVIENIKSILEEVDLELKDVIKTSCFLKNMDDFNDFNEIYGEFFISKPVRSCIEVSKLPKEALCEIEVIAYKER